MERREFAGKIVVGALGATLLPSIWSKAFAGSSLGVRMLSLPLPTSHVRHGLLHSNLLSSSVPLTDGWLLGFERNRFFRNGFDDKAQGADPYFVAANIQVSSDQSELVTLCIEGDKVTHIKDDFTEFKHVLTGAVCHFPVGSWGSVEMIQLEGQETELALQGGEECFLSVVQGQVMVNDQLLGEENALLLDGEGAISLAAQENSSLCLVYRKAHALV